MKFFCKSQRDEKNHHQQQHQPQLEEEETVTTSQMGQFSSTEVQAASAVAGKAVISSAASICAAENGTEKGKAARQGRMNPLRQFARLFPPSLGGPLHPQITPQGDYLVLAHFHIPSSSSSIFL
jgi:hypothetical protein